MAEPLQPASRSRGILFSAPMVRALLAGTKTQTRRAVKYPVEEGKSGWHPIPGGWRFLPGGSNRPVCPYGKAGDRLWVRETWSADPIIDDSWASTQWAGCGRVVSEIPERFHHPRFCNYAADWLHGPIRWTPSIHMPRWASRITLELTELRIERLQDICEADAIAEGIEPSHIDTLGRQQWKVYPHDDGTPGEEIVTYCGSPFTSKPVDAYRSLWLSINGPGSWDANPFVWVLSFKNV